MPQMSPDVETLRAALSLANRAPSIHNSQPWLWRVGPHSVHLHVDRSLRLEHADPDSRNLIVSCGAALNHCAIALTALGWQPKIHRFPNPADDSHLASLELHRHTPVDSDIALAAAIPRRRTDRRNFGSWPVSLSDVALMGARAARYGVTMRRVEVTTTLKAILAQAAWQHAADPAYVEELASWSGHHGLATGVPARNIFVSDARAKVPGRFFAGTALHQPADVPPDEDNGIILGLGTRDDDELGRLRAGEATSVVTLTATALGLASCPVSEPLEIPAVRDDLQADVFGPDVWPQMLLRIGWAAVNADPLPATPRRPVEEVTSWLDGSALIDGVEHHR
ncbi:nitroreductase family protein [soil metagenome]